MGQEDSEFWKAYRDDPERKQRKAHQKRQREEEREEQAKERKIQRLEDRKRTTCHDWLLHEGNVHFCRSRKYFKTYEEYHPRVTVTYPDLGRLRVHGIGIAQVGLKRQLGQDTGMDWNFHACLHIPDARCNGVSIHQLEGNGHTVKRRKDDLLTVYNKGDHASMFCGSVSSCRMRLYLAGEKQNSQGTAEHTVKEGTISISADIDGLRTLSADIRRFEKTGEMPSQYSEQEDEESEDEGARR
ncbi:hypothetical protein LTR37_001496 [Vermiconidia calcicola]|uniref:Uncharacterized protein n=1 Tax=Vermiconidia calcicola TaxID=1690605 RepID=A0ACC3NUZ8_9PEZI|nr:hypothetical protein LTR37_001496 [Vermiconidia calcicola]